MNSITCNGVLNGASLHDLLSRRRTDAGRLSTTKKELVASIREYFAELEDPRIERTRLHSLDSMIIISILAVICGADGFVAIEQFAQARAEWLRSVLDLPNGIPSHDTFGRVFAALEPKQLTEAFQRWTDMLATTLRGVPPGKEPTSELRYFISSRTKLTAKTALASVRAHWGIENALHWVLDIAYREDDSRIRVDNAAENFSIIRQLTANLLTRATSIKVGIKNKRLRAGWDDAFLLSVLAGTG